MDITHMFGLWGGTSIGTFSLVFLAVIVWGFFWKGFALWYSAKRGESWWFIAFLLINTAGILEIVYIFFIARIHEFRKHLGLR